MMSARSSGGPASRAQVLQPRRLLRVIYYLSSALKMDGFWAYMPINLMKRKFFSEVALAFKSHLWNGELISPLLNLKSVHHDDRDSGRDARHSGRWGLFLFG